MELLLILFLTIGGLMYIGYPIFTDKMRWEYKPQKALSRNEELRSRKAIALAAIKELEFDYQTGKLSSEDYNCLKSRYEGEAIETMKSLDGLQKGGKRFRTNKGSGGDLICSSCAEEVPAKGRFCPNCGTKFTEIADDAS